jgi:hypothetical protein
MAIVMIRHQKSREVNEGYMHMASILIMCIANSLYE